VPDTKIADLTTATPAAADLVPIVDVSDTTDSAAGSSRKATVADLLGLTPVLTGLTLHVDSVNGNNGTAVRGDAAKPYLTIVAAKAAAQSGDLIAVRPGAYTVASSLAKAGVNWDMPAGSSLTLTLDGVTNHDLLGDGGAAIAYRVVGLADLLLTGQHAEGPGDYSGSAVVRVGHANSDVTVRARRIRNTAVAAGDGTDGTCLYQTAGRAVVEAEQVEGSTCLWWDNGSGSIRAGQIVATAYAVIGSVDATPTGDWTIIADRISAGNLAIEQGSTHAEAKIWVICPLVEGTTGAIRTTGGKLYVTAQKLSAGSGSLNQVVNCGGGETWITAQKLTETDGGDEASVVVSGGVLWLDLLEYQDESGSASAAVRIEGGTLNLRGARVVLTAGSGLEISGGTARLTNCVIDTSANGSGNPVVVSGGTLTLADCALKAASGRYAVHADSPVTLVIEGTLAIDTSAGGLGIHPNVTIVGTTAPHVPTAAPGTNTTQAASTAFVTAAVGVVLGGVSASFDTLAELAAALALKAPIASPAFTGDGTITGTWSASRLYGVNTAGVYWYQRADAADTMTLAKGSTDWMEFNVSFGMIITGGITLGFCSAGSINAPDAQLDRAAAGVIGLRRDGSSNPGTLRSVPRTPAQITGDQNDYAPGLARYYRLSSDASRTITGLSVGQVDGQECEVWNVGAQNIVLAHDTTSTAANRFLCTGAANITLAADEVALLRYDATTQRWRTRKV